MKAFTLLAAPLLTLGLAVGPTSLFAEAHRWAAPEPVEAVVVLRGPSTVNGTVHFRQDAPWAPVYITGNVTGLDANALRGFHVHQYGDLTDGCASAGGHYNPFNRTHGAPTDHIRHVGDLGNIESDDDGVAQLDFKDNVLTLVGPWSIIGRAVVVHSGTDDLGRGNDTGSQLTGNAGSRSACGVIGLAPTE